MTEDEKLLAQIREGTKDLRGLLDRLGGLLPDSEQQGLDIPSPPPVDFLEPVSPEPFPVSPEPFPVSPECSAVPPDSEPQSEPLTQLEVLETHKPALRALLADLLQPDISPEHYYSENSAGGFSTYVCILRNREGVPFVGHAYNFAGEKELSREIGEKMAYADALGSLFRYVGQDIGLLRIYQDGDGQSEG